MKKLDQLKARHSKLKAQIVEESKAFFSEQSKVIFDKFPTIENFSWRQYTPYFNDGDECTFSVKSDAEINGIDEYNSDESETAKIPSGAFDKISKLIDSIDSYTMKDMFGDHCEITVTKTGVDVSPYEHD